MGFTFFREVRGEEYFDEQMEEADGVRKLNQLNETDSEVLLLWKLLVINSTTTTHKSFIHNLRS